MTASSIRQTLFKGFIALAALFTLAACQQASPPPATISATDLNSRIEAGTAPLILDVRTPDEYSAGHVPGAVLIPHSEVAERINELPANKQSEIVVYCRSGKRAGMAEEALAAAGYSGLRHLDGDWLGWEAEGLPFEN